MGKPTVGNSAGENGARARTPLGAPSRQEPLDVEEIEDTDEKVTHTTSASSIDRSALRRTDHGGHAADRESIAFAMPVIVGGAVVIVAFLAVLGLAVAQGRLKPDPDPTVVELESEEPAPEEISGVKVRGGLTHEHDDEEK